MQRSTERASPCAPQHSHVSINAARAPAAAAAVMAAAAAAAAAVLDDAGAAEVDMRLWACDYECRMKFVRRGTAFEIWRQ